MDSGEPWVLEPFQREITADILAGTREVLVLIPKGNAKTTLLAGLALYHLLTTPDAMVPIGAASREQAGILYRQAAGFIRRSPQLAEVLKPQDGYRRIVRRDDRGVIQVYAADADTGDGVIPTLALVDELHRHKDDGLYGVWRDGLGKRNGQIVTISTAGAYEDSPLGRMRVAARGLPGAKRTRAHTIARSPDFVMHEWALEPADDLDDLKLVKQANPLKAVTLNELRKRRDSPTMTHAQWARFACGVWLAGDETAISAVDWAACADPDATIDDLGEIIIGVDLGWKYDTTALVAVGTDGGRVVVGPVRILVPPRDGRMLSEDVVMDALRDLVDEYPVRAVVLDPNAGGYQLAQRLEGELGVPFAEHSQKPSTMATAATRLLEAIREKRLIHPDDDHLNRHVLAAAGKQLPGGEQRFVKLPRSKRPIDALIALTMAHNVAIAEAEPTWDGPLIEVFG